MIEIEIDAALRMPRGPVTRHRGRLRVTLDALHAVAMRYGLRVAERLGVCGRCGAEVPTDCVCEVSDG